MMMENVGTASDTARSTGDRAQQLETLYRTEYLGMVRLAYTLVSNDREAEEIVQDSFVDVYRRLNDIRRPGAYLRSAVVSRCRSALRRRRVVAAHPPEPPAGLSSDATELWDVLAELSEDQRTAIVLRYYGGYRASEISRIVDQPAATVRSHLRRGLAKLRGELEP